MFNPEEVEGYSKLSTQDNELFKRFCTIFCKVWEYPEDHEPTSIKRMDRKYLEVTLSDGDWLHILKNGSWY